MIPIQPRAREQNHGIQRNQRQKKVNADKKTLGERENIFRNINLVDQAEIRNHAAHGKVAGFAVIIEISKTDENKGKIADTRR